MNQKSLYETIQEIVQLIRAGKHTYQELKDILLEQGMSSEEAENLLDRLVAQVEEE